MGDICLGNERTVSFWAACPCWTQEFQLVRQKLILLEPLPNSWATRWLRARGSLPTIMVMHWGHHLHVKVSWISLRGVWFHVLLGSRHPLVSDSSSMEYAYKLLLNQCVCWEKKGLGLPTLPSCWCHLYANCFFACLLSFTGILCFDRTYLSVDFPKKVHEVKFLTRHI